MTFFLSLSLFFSGRFLWAQRLSEFTFFARSSKTQSRRCSASSLHSEGACGLCEQSKSRVRDLIGFLCKPGNISLFFSPLLFSLADTIFPEGIPGGCWGWTTAHIESASVGYMGRRACLWHLWVVVLKGELSLPSPWQVFKECSGNSLMPGEQAPFLHLCKVWPSYLRPVQSSHLSSNGRRVARPLLQFSSDHPLLAFKFEKALSERKG